ncbi:YihY/virulence factor BrkB family protein [Pyruvatibacter sp.]|uniref:YihY/virulence factor BrkB family protein n=1 Tax=Pyruvatibacter sp. TaxID=1981328 RepID=UPI0032EE6BD8
MKFSDPINATRVFVWDARLDGAPVWQRVAQHVLRVAGVLIRDFSVGTLNLHAMSLVYTTLLALIPALAIVFSVLKGFGVDRELEVFLTEFLAPLGDQGVEIRTTVLEFVAQVNIGVLGSVGFAVLIYTGVSLLQKVEAAFNEIWQVRRLRPLARRFSDFVSVLLVGPILLVVAMGLMASVAGAAAIDGVGSGALRTVISEMSRLVPYAAVIIAFTIIYMMIPNTRVRLTAALTGAVVAGIAWNLAGWAFASFVVTSARYAVIYSAFASLVVFMFWMYVGWLILLAGAGIAFYQQNPAYLTRSAIYRLSIDARERLGLEIGMLVATAFERGDAPWTAQRLARAMRLPLPPVERVVDFLLQEGMLVETGAELPGLMPGKPLDKISLHEWLNVVRQGAEGKADLASTYADQVVEDAGAVAPLFDRLTEARAQTLAGMTLHSLAEQRAVSTVSVSSPGGKT